MTHSAWKQWQHGTTGGNRCFQNSSKPRKGSVRKAHTDESKPTLKGKLTMTNTEAYTLVTSELETLRVRVNELTDKFKQPENSGWIGRASKKQLVAELVRLYANNHKEGK